MRTFNGLSRVKLLFQEGGEPALEQAELCAMRNRFDVKKRLAAGLYRENTITLRGAAVNGEKRMAEPSLRIEGGDRCGVSGEARHEKHDTLRSSIPVSPSAAGQLRQENAIFAPGNDFKRTGSDRDA